jgi:hypothetical protein
VWSFGLGHRVILYVKTSASKEHATPIIRVYLKMEVSWHRIVLYAKTSASEEHATPIIRVYLKMEVSQPRRLQPEHSLPWILQILWHWVAIPKISLLMLVKYTMTIYFENHMKPTNQVCGKNTEILLLKVVHIGVVLYRAKRLGLLGFLWGILFLIYLV